MTRNWLHVKAADADQQHHENHDNEQRGTKVKGRTKTSSSSWWWWWWWWSCIWCIWAMRMTVKGKSMRDVIQDMIRNFAPIFFMFWRRKRQFFFLSSSSSWCSSWIRRYCFWSKRKLLHLHWLLSLLLYIWVFIFTRITQEVFVSNYPMKQRRRHWGKHCEENVEVGRSWTASMLTTS